MPIRLQVKKKKEKDEYNDKRDKEKGEDTVVARWRKRYVDLWSDTEGEKLNRCHIASSRPEVSIFSNSVIYEGSI